MAEIGKKTKRPMGAVALADLQKIFSLGKTAYAVAKDSSSQVADIVKIKEGSFRRDYTARYFSSAYERDAASFVEGEITLTPNNRKELNPPNLRYYRFWFFDNYFLAWAYHRALFKEEKGGTDGTG